MGAMPREVAENEELITLLLPTIRADLGLSERYAWSEATPLNMAIVALGGADDAEVSSSELEQWAMLTTDRFVLHLLPGRHFFVRTGQARFLEILSAELSRLWTELA